MWKGAVGSQSWGWWFPNLSVVVLDTTRNHQDIRSNGASCIQTLWSKMRARGHTEAPVWGTQRVRTFLCLQGTNTKSRFSDVFSLQGGVLVKAGSACQGWSLLLLLHLTWMASPILWKASSFERPHKHKEYLHFPGASLAAGYKVGKNKGLPCLVIMGLKPTSLTLMDLVRDPWALYCLSLTRLAFQQWVSPTPGAPCGMDIGLVGWDMLWGMEVIPSAWLPMDGSTRECGEGCSLKQEQVNPDTACSSPHPRQHQP